MTTRRFMSFDSIVAPLLGGTLIGLSAAGLLFALGEIAGVSGILGAFVRPGQDDRAWRGFFLAGLAVGGFAFSRVQPQAFATPTLRSPLTLFLAGLAVGFGARLGGGCTSGHGVCGIGRRSPRSIFATLTFMASGAATVFVVRNLLGGAP